MLCNLAGSLTSRAAVGVVALIPTPEVVVVKIVEPDPTLILVAVRTPTVISVSYTHLTLPTILLV